MTPNPAFIKADRHDAAEPSPASHVGEIAARSRIGARAATARAARVANAESIGATVAYVSSAGADDDPNDGPLDSIEVATITAADGSPYAPGASAYVDSTLVTPCAPAPQAPHGPSPVKRPLSSFRTQIAGRGAATPPSMTLRPGTTIASFRWPMACRNLLQHHGHQFDRITATLLAQADQGRSLVGILGLFRGVGCTTTALCLAARLAARGRRVVAVDGNFQAPQLAACLDAEPTAWWQDVLERGAALADAMVRAENDGLDLLPLDPYTRPTPPALQLAATAGALRHAYDLALVDLGTFFDPNSQPAVLDLVEHMRIDSVVAVAGPSSHDPRDLETVAEHLSERGCELLGMIENRIAS
jgi:Mrp family chromosome partitioning ATPase